MSESYRRIPTFIFGQLCRDFLRFICADSDTSLKILKKSLEISAAGRWCTQSDIPFLTVFKKVLRVMKNSRLVTKNVGEPFEITQFGIDMLARDRNRISNVRLDVVSEFVDQEIFFE